MRPSLPAAVTAVLVTVTVAVSGCSGPAATRAAGGTTVTVFAAASLKATFTRLGRTFEASHPGTAVVFNFAGSQALAEQIAQGAPADAFASANEASMATVTGAGRAAGQARPFATNTLTIAVPPDNPAAVATFADLARPGLKLVVCAPAVPCGAATLTLEEATGVTLAPVSEEQAVTDVLAKVRAGEADAGLVYATDVIASGDSVRGIAFPESSRAVNRNVIVALSGGPQSGLGQEFVDLVRSAEGQQVLADAGFGTAT